MVVRDLMLDQVTTIRPEATLLDALSLLRTLEVRVLPVVDEDGKLVGVIADRDLARGVAPGAPRPTRVADLMESDVATTIGASIRDPARRMAELRIGAVPVVGEDGRFAGIITYADVLRALLDRAA